MVFTRTVIFLTFTLFFTNVVWADHDASEANSVVVLGLVEFPPLVIRDPVTYQCYGAAVDRSVAVLNKVGIKVHVECIPPARLFELMRAGKVDITINVKTTGALVNYVKFADTPFANLAVGHLVNVEVEDDNSITAIRGYDYHGLRNELIGKGYKFFDVTNSTDAVNLYARGRTANLLTYMAPYEYFLDMHPTTIVNSKIVTTRAIPTYFAVSNVSPKQTALINLLNEYAQKNHLSFFVDRED